MKGAWGLECHLSFQKGQEGGPREPSTSQPHLSPGKMMELLVLEAISYHRGDKKVVTSGQHGFTKDNNA